jgi:putative transposase
MTLPTDLIDELLKDHPYGSANPHTILHWLFWPSLSTKDCTLDRRFAPAPQDILGEQGLLKQLTKAIIERCLEAEVDTYLRYPKYGRKSKATSNARNGHNQKTLKGDFGQVDIQVPRDRLGEFQPQIIKKGQTHLAGLDERMVALYARGMSHQDVQAYLQDLYGVEVSPILIANVTNAVMEEVSKWQAHPLEHVYSIVYVDCLIVKDQESQGVGNFAVYLILGVNLSGQKELLDVWMARDEEPTFWLAVFKELQNRGVLVIFIACVDKTISPLTRVQLCKVRLVRNSLSYVSHKH